MTVEAEQFVLGAILEEPSVIKGIDLSPDDFSSESNKEIYRAMLSVESRTEVPEILAIGQELEKATGQNWIGVLAQMQNQTTGSRYISSHIAQIKKTTARKTVSTIANNLIYQMEALDDMSAVDTAIAALMSINQAPARHDKMIKEVLKEVLTEIDNTNEGIFSGVSTGFRDLDNCIGSFHNSDLIIIGARPAMGKTALLINMMMNANVSAGMFTAEQPAVQIGQRILSSTSEVAAYKMRTGNICGDIEYPRLSTAIARLADRQVYFYEEASPTIATVQRMARQWKHRYDIKALYVDYTQRLEGNNPRDSRTEQVAEISRGLKNLARELDIPVIALAQVSRDVEKRQDKRPRMGDLSNSSELEKESDVVILLYRDEVYNDNTQYAGVAELLVDKNRHGGTGKILLNWNAPILKFKDTQNYERH